MPSHIRQPQIGIQGGETDAPGIPGPAVPNPEITPQRNTDPEIFPQKSPEIPRKQGFEIQPGHPDFPEITPQRSPNIHPDENPPEIRPINQPFGKREQTIDREYIQGEKPKEIRPVNERKDIPDKAERPPVPKKT